MKKDINNTTQTLSIPLESVAPGKYALKYFAQTKDGYLVKQDVADVTLESASTGGNSNYEYVFPDSLKSYKAGTVVLQPKDGKTYECKPFPYSGYCIQWNSGATHYEPGVGSNWKDAWVQK